MRNSLSTKLLTAIVTGAILLTGCSAGTKQADPPAAANAKPPLVVPKSFDTEQAKRDFAVKAVNDGYYAEARPLLEESIAAAPDATALSRLGTAKYNLADYNGAVEAWSKAAELDPNLVGEMHNNIGNALRDSKKLEEAEAAYRTALKVEPTRWTAAINLASMLQLSGNLSEAIKVVENALAANKEIEPLSSFLSSLKEEAQK